MRDRKRDVLRMGMLIEACKYYKYVYYEQSKNEISDAEYDKLERELIELLDKNRSCIRQDTPRDYVDSYVQKADDIRLSEQGLKDLLQIVCDCIGNLKFKKRTLSRKKKKGRS